MGTRTYQSIEDALIGLAKLLKNVSYYPDGHPSLNAAINLAVKLFVAVNAHSPEPLVLGVSRGGFSIEETPLESKNPLVVSLAERLFFHKVKVLTIFPDLIDRHLLSFCRIICEEPASIIARGGITNLLDQQLVATLSVNELSLTAATSRKNSLENTYSSGNTSNSSSNSQSSTSTLAFQLKAREMSMKEILQNLDTILHNPSAENETPFLRGLGQLTQLLRQLLHENSREQILKALQQIDLWLQNNSLDQRFIKVLKQAVRSMGDQSLVDLLLDNATNSSSQALARHLISELQDDIATILINRLSEELDHRLRKFISQLLVNMGDKAFPELIKSLEDERWFVVRNAIAILAENRHETLIPSFVTQLNHADARVVNEAIRALARIRTTKSSEALIEHLESGGGDFPQQIILALGALADPIAVPPLTKIARQSDPFLHKTALIKVALVALGEIGDPDAIPTLLHILERFKLFKRREYNELRCQAASALNGFSDDNSLRALQRASKSSHRPLATAARQALRQRGQEDNDQ